MSRIHFTLNHFFVTFAAVSGLRSVLSLFSALVSLYAVNSLGLQFSKADAAYLAGVFWTTFTGGRIISIFVAAFFDVKQLLIVSHALVICASG